MFALLALVLFVLAAFGVNWESANIVYLGLASLALHFLIGGPFIPNWVTVKRRN